MDVLNCRVDKLSGGILTYIQMKITHPWFHQCMRDKERNQTECLEHFRQSCLSSQIRSFKTIRLPMEIIDRLITIDPTVKIIYSTRDPRGMINSRMILERFPDSDFGNKVIDLCVHVEHDYRLFLKNKAVRKYTYELSYDNLISDLVGQTKSIYNYLGINNTDSVVLRRIAQLDRSRGKSKTPRSIPKWKKSLTDEHVNIVNKECAWLLKQLGFIQRGGF